MDVQFPNNGPILEVPSQFRPEACFGVGCCGAGRQPPIFVPLASVAPGVSVVPGQNCCGYAFQYVPEFEAFRWIAVITFGGCNPNCGTDNPADCQTPDCYAHNFFGGLDPCTGAESTSVHLDCRTIAYTIGPCGLDSILFLPVPVAPSPTPVQCPNGTALNAQGGCSKVDPPLPSRALHSVPHEISVLAIKAGRDVAGPSVNLPLLPIPTGLPLPTMSIAVTACNCGSDEEEGDFLDAAA
jgi:hypothetical protein